ncbi:hypothetical protein [Variovorax sp. MHTC-1]|uniref:hypothetical protein n=1 Tax=Variovorax sp. MHTC-1 TaxID=2495593 RepID=UPI000F89C1B8|nr:hypothetical protein [Variovorax sp. MHTC-1]RST47572.1 hypothetical protein EJI01_27800 [Variovorax sp. MHTC-1]
MNSMTKLASAACLVAILAACGGGGSSTGGIPPTSSGGNPTTLAVTGTAATGAPIASGQVEAKCATGTASATTVADGRYELAVTNGALPCVIRVTKDGTTLHSIVETGAALPAVANVTPLSELLVAQLTGGPAANLFQNFNGGAQAGLTSSAVTAATAKVVSALSGIIDFSGDDLLRGTLVPAVDGNVGNLLDQKLDALARALSESNTSLAQLSAALVAAPGEAPTALASVPASATTCPALRSGTYWGLEAEDPQLSVDPFEVDARALTVLYGGEPEKVHLVPFPGEACRFTIGDDGGIDGVEHVVVSRAGVIVSHFPEDGLRKPFLGFPKQDISQADLAGDWNYVGWVGPMATLTPINGSFTLDAATGTMSNIANYIGTTLEAEPAGEVHRIVKNAENGAFNQIANGEVRPAYFLPFRGLDGQVYLVANPQDGPQGLVFAAKKATLPMPTVGTVNSYWETEILAATTPGGIGQAKQLEARTTTTIEVQGDVIKRRRPAISEAPERIDVVKVNGPRDGMRLRQQNACTDRTGAAMTCAGMVQLPLPGMGLTATAGLFDRSFASISVTRP